MDETRQKYSGSMTEGGDPVAPSIGRNVHYTLSQADVTMINRRRTNGGRDVRSSGEQVHVGRPVSPGDIFPSVVVKVEVQPIVGDGPAIALQVFLDGNDVLWVPSCEQAEHGTHGTWDWPPRL